jgi:hypothetical protein
LASLQATSSGDKYYIWHTTEALLPGVPPLLLLLLWQMTTQTPSTKGAISQVLDQGLHTFGWIQCWYGHTY